MSVKTTQKVPTNGGLNLYSEVSRTAPGELIEAINKGRGIFGPRHSYTRVGNANRARANPKTDGVGAYIRLLDNPAQWDLGTEFSVDIFFRVTTIPAANGYLLTTAHPTDVALDIWLDTEGKINADVRDNGGNSVVLVSRTQLGDGDTCRVRVSRGSGVVALLVSAGTRMVREAVSTGLNKNLPLAVVRASRLIAAPPAYSGGAFLDCVLGLCLLRTREDLTSEYIFGEYPTPHGNNVAGCWTEVRNDVRLRDNSRFVNHGTAFQCLSAGLNIFQCDIVQALGTHVDADGREYNYVAAGGELYREEIHE